MKHTLKFIGMLMILLVGVVIGLQTAERGIYAVEGKVDQQPQTFYVKKVDNGQVEIAVMGKTKQVEAKAPEVGTYVSKFGETLGQMIKVSTKRALEWVAGWF